DQLGQGKENARNFLKDNPDLANEIEKKILEKLGIGVRPDADAGEPAADAAATAAGAPAEAAAKPATTAAAKAKPAKTAAAKS
ncbi:DNA recombination/repair protein RecA, partial [Streptomyces sp. NPDC026589]